MAENPERAAEWDAAAVGDMVQLMSVDCDPPCAAAIDHGNDFLLCTRDRGHKGDHVATGESVVLRRWPT